METSVVRVGIVANNAWSGGEVYTQNLVRALSQLPPAERVDVVLVRDRTVLSFLDLVPLATSEVTFRNWTGSRRTVANSRFVSIVRRVYGRILGDAWPELALALRRGQVTVSYPVLHSQHRLVPGAITWIPDLQHRLMPHLFSPQEIAGRDSEFRSLLSSPGDVVFSSRSALKDAVDQFGTPVARTHILRFVSVPDSWWYDDPAPIMARYGVKTPYFIVCNQFWEHKDHATLFRAVHLLAQQHVEVSVICTGSTEDYRNPQYYPGLRRELDSWDIVGAVNILGRIPRFDQIMLMRGSAAVIQPSRFEGWSTVLEDARALNKTVVASDIKVHLEQAVPNAIYFRAGDPLDCARALRQCILAGTMGLEPNGPRGHMPMVQKFARAFLDIVKVARLPSEQVEPAPFTQKTHIDSERVP